MKNKLDAVKCKEESKMYKELRLAVNDVNVMSDAMMLLVKTFECN
jgi:hypothetical protein